MLAEVVACAERYLAAIDALRTAQDLPSEIATHELMPSAPVLRVPLFVVDEPEQHLHPRAQRQLARWLANLVRVYDTQALVITHSVAFTQQADRIAYVSRNLEGDASVRPVGLGELSALSEIAADLGINRGELLSGTSIYLFVEGDSDRYVIEALFADRLRQIGVAVLAVRGATQLAQIVDAQVLLRYSTAKMAVLLDNLTRTETERPLNDPEHRATAARGRTEEQAVAKLLNEALAQGRTIDVHGIPVKDIFFLLDPHAIRDTFRELRRSDDTTLSVPALRFDEYPDHDTARTEYSRTNREWTGTRWKKFLLERYGIPFEDVSWYARVADHMRLAGLLPKPLVDVIDALELTALNGTDTGA